MPLSSQFCRRPGLALAVAVVCALGISRRVYAETPVKIGVLTDMSGIYADLSGKGSIVAARLAIEDFSLKYPDRLKVELISADHQNKSDVGAAIARRWLDTEGVNAIVDLPASAVALAVSDIGAQKNAAILVSAGVAESLTNAVCRPTTVQWTYDTYALSHGAVRALAGSGAKNWFFVTGNFVAAREMEAESIEELKAAGGSAVGSVRVPLGTPDFASFLLQAQSSKAQLIAILAPGDDLVNATKQARDFGIAANGQRIAALIAYISDVHAMGLEIAQGITLVTAFYWDRDEGSRSFSKRFSAKLPGRMPTMVQAGVYSVVLNYLLAVNAVGSASDGKRVVDQMKGRDIVDPLFGNVRVASNGRAFHDMYLVEVKKPSESRYPWDYYSIKSVIPAEKAFRPVAESKCPLVAN